MISGCATKKNEASPTRHTDTRAGTLRADICRISAGPDFGEAFFLFLGVRLQARVATDYGRPDDTIKSLTAHGLGLFAWDRRNKAKGDHIKGRNGTECIRGRGGLRLGDGYELGGYLIGVSRRCGRIPGMISSRHGIPP